MCTLRIRCLVLAMVFLAGTMAACTTEGPAGFCGAIGTDVVGLDEVVSADGGATVVGTWVHVLVEGVVDADASSRAAIAVAVGNDQDGFQRVRNESAEEMRPALDRLNELVQDPALSAERSRDADVLQDVDTVRERSGSAGCGFLQ